MLPKGVRVHGRLPVFWEKGVPPLHPYPVTVEEVKKVVNDFLDDWGIEWVVTRQGPEHLCRTMDVMLRAYEHSKEYPHRQAYVVAFTVRPDQTIQYVEDMLRMSFVQLVEQVGFSNVEFYGNDDNPERKLFVTLGGPVIFPRRRA